jgi:glyoxylase-like metal-dependent hydrolase (beta-lactamase superfamily II)
MLNIVNVGYDSTNYYVVATDAPRLLIDVGFPGTMPKLLGALRRVGIALGSIPYLLATHYHPDHAGLAQELKGAGLRLVALDVQRAAIPRLGRYVKPAMGYHEIALHDNIYLAAGESRAFLRRIGLAGEIIATPGHSDDSVTLILDGGAAFTGDLTPPALADDPASPALQSWAAIRARGATTIYPGHGPARPVETTVGG